MSAADSSPSSTRRVSGEGPRSGLPNTVIIESGIPNARGRGAAVAHALTRLRAAERPHQEVRAGAARNLIVAPWTARQIFHADRAGAVKHCGGTNRSSVVIRARTHRSVFP